MTAPRATGLSIRRVAPPRIRIENVTLAGGRAADVRAEDGTVKVVGDLGSTDAEKIVDIEEDLFPLGAIDVHTHLRKPGFEYRET